MKRSSYPQEVWLNGEWSDPQKASISVFDRGFLFGDGIYEVAPFYNGNPFRLQEHLDRLAYCLREIRISYDVSQLKPVILEAVQRAGLGSKDAAVYLQVTRGAAPRTHHFPKACTPTVFLYAFPVPLEGFQDRQVDTIATRDLRWQRCDIKTISLLPNVMKNSAAIEAGYFENLLIRDGIFTEASHSSVFFVKADTVYTHPEGPFILSGITRKVVLALCRGLGIPVREVGVPVQDLEEVDELFLTGTTTQILSVRSLQHEHKELFFAARAGRITRKLQQAFLDITRGSGGLTGAGEPG